MQNKRVTGRGRPQHYSDDFQWKVVQEVLSGEITQAEAKRKYNIKSNSAILYWTRQLSGIHDYRDSRVVYLPEHDMSQKKKKDTSKPDEKLFAFSYSTLRSTLYRLNDKLGFKIQSHDFRKYCLSNLANSGVNIFFVKSYARHSDIKPP